ncbi:MAG: hypothetical protein EA425_00010 [Puniceicoccaceae bacterium]|nr:MAG: hypothetical protein EA425_00010 [Puniceicoccaceae bacterium]
MKAFLVIVLLVSLGFNLYLARGWEAQRSAAPSSDPHLLHHTTPAGPNAAAQAPAAETTDAPLSWEKLRELSPGSQVVRLREAGWPDRLIESVVAHPVDQRIADLSRRSMALRSLQRYWEMPSPDEAFSHDYLARYQRLQAEREQLLEAAFGERQSPSVFGFQPPEILAVPAEKRSAVREILSDYAAVTARIHAEAGGMLLAEDREKLRELEQQRRRDLQEVLTPEELFEMDLRTSPTSMALRWELQAFSPTEEEFREIFQIRQVFEELAPQNRPGAPIADPDLRAEMDRQIRELLDEERYRDYQLAQDPRFQSLTLLTRRLGLPAETARQIHFYRESHDQALAAVREDPALDDEERSLRIEALEQEAREVLTDALGERGYQALRSQQRAPAGAVNIQRLGP